MSSQYKPPDREAVNRQYEQNRPLYQQLVEEVVYMLRKALSEKSVETGDIVCRVKDFDSLYRKILKEEYKEDIFNLVEDIAGVRIICLYRSDLEKIEEIIRKKLDVIKAELLRDRSVGQFGYMSDHYITRLPSSYSGDRYDAIKSLKCEIQVRTIAMHAWATVSHHLDYKQEFDIPTKLKSDFYALSGIFYIADSLFEQFRNAREESMDVLRKKTSGGKFDLTVEMNFDTMYAYLCWKFPDRNKTSDISDLSDALRMIRKAKINSFTELNDSIDKNLDWLLDLEKKDPPVGLELIKEAGKEKVVQKKTRYLPVGIIRVILRDRLKKIKEVD